jgi:hypothetical protein
MPRNANSIAIHPTPSPPTLDRLPVSSFPIPCQIALGFLPPLRDLLTALSPIESRRLRVQTFLFEGIHNVFEFRVPALICSFLLREREEQGLTRVERDLGLWKEHPCG